MTYTSRIRLGKHKAKRSSKNGSKRSYHTAKWQAKKNKRSYRKHKVKSYQSAIASSLTTILITIIFFVSIGFAYVQYISKDLPSPDKPFSPQNLTSNFYDRNGQPLYRFFGEENRDQVHLEEIPPLQIWAILAAEDIEYYEHSGVDINGIASCAIDGLKNNKVTCGASTVTQQLIKQTALSSEVKFDRKFREIILAFQIEQLYSKDEILEMYLTVIPEGSNVYSINSASKFYFGKRPDQLNLAEMAILAAIPQNPSQLSPTKSSDPVHVQELLTVRKEYVLSQMEENMDYINNMIIEHHGEDAELLTQEMIDEAREYELAYKNPDYEIIAPHFIFYVQDQLTTGNYNNGQPFTIEELQTGGYKIWTTLDQEFQIKAEEQVVKGVNEYGSKYGAENAGMVVMQPKTGEILAMVGSKDYFGNPSPAGCKLGENCRFEPNVNVTNTLQSYGSSMKPMVYYLAIRQGLISPGTVLADVPIQLGEYKPKNYEGNFSGMRTARWMLVNSRNIPAIYLVDHIGVNNFVSTMQDWGYSTLDDPRGYGPSIAVGGADITLIDHAQAYGVFANDGYLTQKEVVLRIEDKDGNVIYEHEPQTRKVADSASIYLVNHMLNGRYGGPGVSWDGRDISGKTGTSESQKETLFATYTPEIVVIGWLGNNNNDKMLYGASGMTSAKPWVSEYVQIMGDKIPSTAFTVPDNIISVNGDLAIAGVNVPRYVQTKTALVCVDQPYRLARPIDIAYGKAIEKTYLYFGGRYLGNGSMPTSYCTIPRSGSYPNP